MNPHSLLMTVMEEVKMYEHELVPALRAFRRDWSET